MKYAIGIAVVVGVLYVAAQFGLPEWNNLELQDDLHDLAAQLGSRIGANGPKSDEDLRLAVIRKAQRYDIELDPGHVIVQRSGPADSPSVYLAVDYTVPVNLLVYTYTLHFTPSSTGGGRF